MHQPCGTLPARKVDVLMVAPEWIRQEILEFSGSVDGPWSRYVQDADARGIGTLLYPRTVPKDEECAKQLAKRTSTAAGSASARPVPAWHRERGSSRGQKSHRMGLVNRFLWLGPRHECRG